jgi:hypothetical protein
LNIGWEPEKLSKNALSDGRSDDRRHEPARELHVNLDKGALVARRAKLAQNGS